MSTSSLVQALPEAWRSTKGLAIVGSLGIHTLLLVVLPFVSLDPQEVDLQSSIGVVELSPEEQSRVPQVAADPSVIPPANTAQQQAPAAAQGFQSEILPPLPAPTPLLPPPPGTTLMYQMPSSDSLPPPAPVPLPPPPQNPSLLSQNPFGQSPAPQPNQTNQNIQMREIAPPANALPPIPDLPPTQDLQPSPPLAQDRATADNSTPKNLPDRAQQERMARQNALAQRLAANRNKADTSPTSDRDRLLEAASQQQVQRAKEREESASRLAATLQQRRQSNPTPTNPPASNPDSDRASRLAALQQRLARPIDAQPDSKPQSESTQTIAQIEALQQQYQKVQQAYPQFVTAAPIRKRVPVCNKKLNGGEAIIAALTDTTGKIVIGPDVISKDSPSNVQRAAIRYVKGYPFTKSTTPVNQTFRLEFSHNPKLCSRK